MTDAAMPDKAPSERERLLREACKQVELAIEETLMGHPIAAQAHIEEARARVRAAEAARG